jgi:alpha-tubulin suppressor-like RCC1 family protein
MCGRFMKLMAASGLVALGCTGDEPLPTQLPSTMAALSSTACQPSDATAIEGEIAALYPNTPALRGSALSQFSSVKKQCTKNPADAQSKAVRLAGFAAKKFLAHQLLPTATAAGVSFHMNHLFLYVGMPQPGDLTAALSGGGGVSAVGPADPTLSVVTGDGKAGVSIATGAISTTQTVLVTVTPAADQTDPLPTTLPQYGPFYDFHTFPLVTKFAQPVTIGICVTVPTAVAGRVQLARPDAASPTTAIEVLARGPAVTFLGCSPLPLASLRVEGEPLAAARRPGLVNRLLAAAKGLLGPALLYARGLQTETTGSVTAKTDNVSTSTTGPADVQSQLVFTTQPADTFAYEPLYPAVEVTVEAGDGTTIKTYQGDVTVAIGNNPATGTLTGTLTKPVVEGVARFDDLRLEFPASGYTLAATASGDVPTPNPATSTAFNITVGPFKGVSAGFEQTCGLILARRVFCWGHNALGQLGDGTIADHLTPLPIVMPDGVTEFASVTSGASFVCALTDDGQAYCWGGDFYGQLGDGNTTNQATPLPVKVVMPAGVSFASLTAFGSSACGLTGSGDAYCWGYNFHGQLGDGTTNNQSTPVKVQLPVEVTSFKSLTAGEVHTCGLTDAGEAWCWGDNSLGQLGDGTTINKSLPVQVLQPAGGSVKYTSLTGGGGHTCGLTDAGPAYCWGTDVHGQLGDGDPGSNKSTPVPVVMPAVTFASLTAGGIHTCALTQAMAAWCWGSNNNGQIGNGSSTDTDTPTPVEVTMPGGVTFASLSLSAYQGCGLTFDGWAYCWGDNWAGQLGDGTTADQPIPTRVKQ